jgi:hypothetical protein
MRTLLTSAPPQLRSIIYEVLKANIRFAAWPLDRYIASAGEMAEREQLPVMDALGNLHPFTPATDAGSIARHAELAIATAIAERTLTLTCGKCLRQESFVGTPAQTPADVVIRARRAGWIHDYTVDPPREICPKCPTSLRQNA